MRCRFRAFGDGELVAEHDGEVVDQDDSNAIDRIMEITQAKGRAALAGKAVRDFRLEGPEFF